MNRRATLKSTEDALNQKIQVDTLSSHLKSPS